MSVYCQTWVYDGVVVLEVGVGDEPKARVAMTGDGAAELAEMLLRARRDALPGRGQPPFDPAEGLLDMRAEKKGDPS